MAILALGAGEAVPSAGLPVDDPAAHHGLAWTGGFAWARVLSVTEVAGATWDERIAAGLARLAAQGGGVLHLPAGDYPLAGPLRLPAGTVLRGEAPVTDERPNYRIGRPPAPVTDAHDVRYRLRTRLIFARYRFTAEGAGTPAATAFHGIHLADEAAGGGVGLVHLAIDHGHIRLGSLASVTADWTAERRTGRHLVYGCLLRNCAVAGDRVPHDFQHPWQRWTDAQVGAITIFASRDVLVANNRIPRSGDDDFAMPGYRVLAGPPERRSPPATVESTVIFDYDNRSGVLVNAFPVLKELAIWRRHSEIEQAEAAGAADALLAPGSLATGIVVADNAIEATGQAAIKCGGDGTRILRNRIRFVAGVVRPTSNGRWMDAHSNGNRAIEIRGWRWEIADNDYEVYSNLTPAGEKYNDGEGIMHEAWENVGVRDSRLTGNTGNAYLCCWRVPVRGLVIADNHIRVAPGFHAIFVNGQTRMRGGLFDLPVYDVRIDHNRTAGSGIALVGGGIGNRVTGNRHSPLAGAPGLLVDEVGARQQDNAGYLPVAELPR
jgi:hypothetical protein